MNAIRKIALALFNIFICQKYYAFFSYDIYIESHKSISDLKKKVYEKIKQPKNIRGKKIKTHKDTPKTLTHL